MKIKALYKQGFARPEKITPVTLIGKLIGNDLDLEKYLAAVYLEQKTKGMEGSNKTFPALHRYNISKEKGKQGNSGSKTKSWINLAEDEIKRIAYLIFKDTQPDVVNILDEPLGDRKASKYIMNIYKEETLKRFKDYRDYIEYCYHFLDEVTSNDEYALTLVEDTPGNFRIDKSKAFWESLYMEREFGGKNRGFNTAHNELMTGKDRFAMRKLRSLVKSDYWYNKIISSRTIEEDPRLGLKSIPDDASEEEMIENYEDVDVQNLAPRVPVLESILSDGIPFQYLDDIIRSVSMGRRKFNTEKYLLILDSMKNRNPILIDIITKLNESEQFINMFNNYYQTLTSMAFTIRNKMDSAVAHFSDKQKIANTLGRMLNVLNSSIKTLESNKLFPENVSKPENASTLEAINSGVNIRKYILFAIKNVKETASSQLNKLSYDIKVFASALNDETKAKQKKYHLTPIEIDEDLNVFAKITLTIEAESKDIISTTSSEASIYEDFIPNYNQPKEVVDLSGIEELEDLEEGNNNAKI